MSPIGTNRTNRAGLMMSVDWGKGRRSAPHLCLGRRRGTALSICTLTARWRAVKRICSTGNESVSADDAPVPFAPSFGARLPPRAHHASVTRLVGAGAIAVGANFSHRQIPKMRAISILGTKPT